MVQFENTMKKMIFGILVVLFCSCHMAEKNNTLLEKRIDDLEKKLDDTYRPGLGEFMSGIQVHHDKLWFAGSNENWKLAQFEIDELKEALEAIQKYCADRPETREITMLEAPIDTLANAIKEHNEAGFKTGFGLLTHTCNACHLATDHGFNVIKIPDLPPFSNQEFRLK